ncbi:hypothetical protein A2V68_01120 [candidate division Kazan bacterium RBG_13_50_9]|uniref:Uncharacterized protein n=1 Tax=candidate division Kazan bacterium RBG_13_50_9 TaxID=1798535 RepID=A0A1F4NSR6_UNCK3|nr:MAG: hypothetical protein A2V68_01120 [candidate division Kazan bacterium RBG_13_50_9]
MSEHRDLSFGQEFERTEAEREINRMDILHPTENLPEYVKFARELRADLRGFIEAEGWPECPEDIKSVDNLFSIGRAVVAEYWKQSAGIKLAAKCEHWAGQITDKDAESRASRELLLDPAKLEEGLHIQQVGVLETIRGTQPEAWRTLAMVASERQLAVLALVRHWAKIELTDERVARLGFGRAELELLLDAAGILGKYIDHAYVKQLEIADLPGGMKRTPLDIRHQRKTGEEELSGAEYLYDYRIVPEGQRRSVMIIKTYSEIFPFEWSRIVDRLRALAERARRLLFEGRLPQSYDSLPEYLEHMAKMYGSDVMNPQELEDAWEELYKAGTKLAEKGCPLMLIAQGATGSGEADKVDIELRLGLQTPETKAAQKLFRQFGILAHRLNQQYADSLDEEQDQPSIVLNIQPLAFGPNVYWMTRGEAEETQILSHTNAVADVALNKELPLLRRLQLVGEGDSEWYKQAAVMETVLHELGHAILPADDDAVEKRVGKYRDTLDEFKAETMGMWLLARASETNRRIDKIGRHQLLAKMGTVAAYLTEKSSQDNSDGEPYYLAGAAQLVALLESGALVESDGRYVIANTARGIQVLAELGDSVLQRFYVDRLSTPEAVAEYLKGLRKLKQDPRLKRFATALRG